MPLKARFIPLLPLVLLLGGCGSDSPPAEQLQSITVKNAEGSTTALTVLDYSQGSLVRVRSYNNQPGEDGITGTADDPLLNNAYAVCRITTDNPNNTAANRGLLQDAYAEAHGGSPIAIFFQPLSDCALPGISASSIANTSYNNPGPDEVWFTTDDVKGLEFTLSHTVTGSVLTSFIPADSNTNVNSTGLDHIVYNPYAGLNVGLQTTHITYDHDAAGQVRGLSQTGHQILYERQSDGFIKTREINPGNGYVAGAFGPFYLREEYEKTSSGKIHVRPLFLLDQADYDAFSGISAGSPVAQILLGILGIEIPTGEQLLALDGNLYYISKSVPQYEIEKTGERLDRIRQITGPGIDTVWHTNDDVIGATATFSYAILH